MAVLDGANTDWLVQEARGGNAAASAALLQRHRQRLRRMVAVRLDPRLGRRVDPSDVVQETLAIANARLPRYLKEAPVPFYPWLRAIAWNRLVDLHRQHVASQRRTVRRETEGEWAFNARSAQLLAGRLSSVASAPSARLMREELQQRVSVALLKLPEKLREVLVLRHLEELPVSEVATVCGVTEGTVKSRHFRALAKLRELLGDSAIGGAR